MEREKDPQTVESSKKVGTVGCVVVEVVVQRSEVKWVERERYQNQNSNARKGKRDFPHAQQ